MQLRGELRPHERNIVERVGTLGAHIVLPGDGGKALIGLELVRRLRRPAVVFGPTVASQLAWQSALTRFADPAGITALSSIDTSVQAPITLLTWDDLAPAPTADTFITDLVVDEWAAELVAAGRAPTREAAIGRISRWAVHNPRKVERTLAHRREHATVRLLRPPVPHLADRLPAKTTRLIDGLAANGVGLVVLDGCDHLGDGRAVLLHHLLHRLRTDDGLPTVIALSDVPRSTVDAHRYCRRLVPGHELEMQAPPVVHAGGLAPYRDLVYIVEPGPTVRTRLTELAALPPTRRVRSAAARLLATSPVKCRAALEILAYEHVARPPALRAAVLAEREGHGEGSGHAIFTCLLDDARGRALAPVLLTEDGLVSAAGPAGDELFAACKTTIERLGLRVRLRRAKAELPGTAAIIGRGEDWSPRTIAMLASRAMASGATRCLVGGADGVLGAGWDVLEIDTLVDLTSLPTAAADRLRSRALRVDDRHAGKVTHLWHVAACELDTGFGTIDVSRMVARLEGRWGLGLGEHDARVVRGAEAMDRGLTGDLESVDYRSLTARCLMQISDREATRRRWAVGSSSNAAVVTSVDAQQVAEPYRVRALLPRLRRTLLLTAALLLLLVAAYGTPLGPNPRMAVQIVALVVAAVLGASIREAMRLLRVTRGSAEARLAARARAVLDALRDTGKVNLHLGGEAVAVRRTEPTRFEVRLSRGTERDARVFATALAETLAPPNGQPFVISAGSRTVPVPEELCGEPGVFEEHWRWHVGIGKLEANRAAHASERPPSEPPPAVALEIWEPGASRPEREEVSASSSVS
jgi:hypothetical protein